MTALAVVGLHAAVTLAVCLLVAAAVPWLLLR